MLHFVLSKMNLLQIAHAIVPKIEEMFLIDDFLPVASRDNEMRCH